MSLSISEHTRWRTWLVELTVSLFIGLLGCTLCVWCSRQFPLEIYDIPAMDIWFDGDSPYLFQNFTNRYSPYMNRTSVHPLYPLVSTVPVQILRRLGVSNRLSEVRIVLGLAAAVWGCSFYALLRVLGNKRLDAVVFSLLALSSASVIFWIGLPEYHFIGSISLILALLLIAAGGDGRLSGVRYTVASALSLSMTVTNWMLGLVAAVVGQGPKRAIQISANALCVVVVLWSFQKPICPSAGFFLVSQRGEVTYMTRPNVARLAAASQAFFLHGMTLPAIGTTPNDWNPLEKAHRLTVQVPPGGHRNIPQGFASVIWISLCLLGLAGMVVSGADKTLKITLLVTILGGYALHLVYGAEVFLYSANYLPLLVVVASLGSQTRYRWSVLGLATVLIAMNLVLNFAQFHRAISLFENQYAIFKASRS